MAKETLLKPNQLVLIGGGSSIKEGINKGLWDKLKGKFTIGLNYSYNFFDSTILCFIDGSGQFYEKESKKKKFKNLPLIIGKKHPNLKVLPNTITLETNDAKYYRDVKLGIWRSNLCGLLALSLGIYLLDNGQIYLLGYDYGTTKKAKDGKALTHFYQGQIKHRGIGKISYFDTKGRANRDFGVYKDEKKVKIYNISPLSKINTFIKKDWDWFFENLNKQQFNQEKLRHYIREKLK